MSTEDLLEGLAAARARARRSPHLALSPDMPALRLLGSAAKRIDERGEEMLARVEAAMRPGWERWGVLGPMIFPLPTPGVAALDPPRPLIALERPGGKAYSVFAGVRIRLLPKTHLCLRFHAEHSGGQSVLADGRALSSTLNVVNRKLRERQARHQKRTAGAFTEPYLQLEGEWVADRLLELTELLPHGLRSDLRRGGFHA